MLQDYATLAQLILKNFDINFAIFGLILEFSWYRSRPYIRDIIRL
jgi:hypothetical protein